MKSKSKPLCCYFHSAYVSVRVVQVPKRGLDLSLLDSPTSTADNSVIFKADDWSVLDVRWLRITLKITEITRFEACFPLYIDAMIIQELSDCWDHVRLIKWHDDFWAVGWCCQFLSVNRISKRIFDLAGTIGNDYSIRNSPVLNRKSWMNRNDILVLNRVYLNVSIVGIGVFL